MNKWVRLGTLDDDGCLAKARMNHGSVDIQICCDEAEILEGSMTLRYKEAFNLACLLPEIKALFQWAKDVREQVDEGHLFLLEAVADEIFEPFERSKE